MTSRRTGPDAMAVTRSAWKWHIRDLHEPLRNGSGLKAMCGREALPDVCLDQPALVKKKPEAICRNCLRAYEARYVAA